MNQDEGKLEKQASWENPYKRRIDGFPGRIFCFKDFASDSAYLHEALRPWAQVFCEIGSGSGGHLLDWAERRSTEAFVGFELRYKRCVRTLEKAAVRGIENVFVIQHRGERIGDIFCENALAGIFVNFPDPWPKLRWSKHRLLSAEFLDCLNSRLKIGGFVSLKSDHQSYFQEFIKVVENSSSFRLAEYTEDLYQSSLVAENVSTEFERLFRAQAAPIYYLKLIKDG